MEAKDWFSVVNSVVSGVCVVLLTVYLLREVRRLRDDADREGEDDGEAWKRGGRLFTKGGA